VVTRCNGQSQTAIVTQSLDYSVVIEPAWIGGHVEADAMQCGPMGVFCADRRIGAH
jgi:hypothetical protein